MGVDQVLLSPWQVTPVTVLPCPTKAKRWEKPPRGKGQTAGTIPGLNVSLVNSGEKWTKNLHCGAETTVISMEDFLKSWTDFHK